MDQLNVVPHQGDTAPPTPEAEDKQTDIEAGLSSSDRKDSFRDEKLADGAAVEGIAAENEKHLAPVPDIPIDPKYVTKFNDKGEPIIETGHDVSRWLVSLRDDGDEPLTVRGFVLGNALAVLNIVVSTLFTVKPTSAGFSAIFNMLILYVAGGAWARLLPGASSVANRPSLKFLERPLHYLNPGPFGLKEHVISHTIAAIGGLGSWSVDTFAVSKLFFHMPITPVIAIMGIFSITVFGAGLLGVLSPMIVAPAEIVYWTQLPQVVTFQNLHYSDAGSKRRLKIFFYSLGGAFMWEIIPAYMMPWLNGLSIPCLATMHSSDGVRRTVSKIFGGAAPNQGFGLFSISLDLQYVAPGDFAGYPLKWQLMYFGGALFGAMIMIALYFGDVWGARSLPMMSSALFTPDGEVYDQTAVFDSNYRLNNTALEEMGLPRMASTEVFFFMTTALGLGALITHVLIFLSKEVREDFRRVRNGTLDDPHYQAMRKYPPVPQWFYIGSFALSIPAAIITVYKTNCGIGIHGLLIAILFGSIMTPVSLSIYGRYGSAVPTMMASKVLAGAVHRGRPVANLFFAQYAHQIVEVTGVLAGNLKVGQYLKIPPRYNVAAQLYGALLGGYIGWWTMSHIIDHQREILLDPQGNNQWYGGYYQDLNAQAVQWSLSSKVFALHSETGYVWVPFCFLIGACVPPVHWVLKKTVRWVRDMDENIATPLFMYNLSTLGAGVNSSFLSSMAVALFCQVWLRLKRPQVFADFNYLVAAALGGGVSIMIFVLSFAVFGASGKSTPFPTWFGNPESPEAPDHCVTGDF